MAKDIAEGEVAYVQGSAADPYELKNIDGVYSCSCPAWRNQSRPIDARTCKHLKKYRGEEAELERLASVDPEGARAAAARKSKSASSSGNSDSTAPPVLLAHKWDNERDLTGWWMSEKLDGVRAYWDGSQFLSRLGNAFLAPEWFSDGLPDHPLDGELWMGRGRFQETVSVVRRMDAGEKWSEVRYVVFDAPHLEHPFEDRIDFLRDTYASGSHDYAYALDHTVCEGLDHLRDELRRIEGLGGEGLMMREPGSVYVAGRSATLLKVKSFHDAEAKVIDHIAGAGRHKGRLGALRVELPNGTVFSVGTGFSDAEREEPPEIGSVITFRYQELTKAGVPRFPSFVAVRDDIAWPPEDAQLSGERVATPKKKKKKKSKKAKKKEKKEKKAKAKAKKTAKAGKRDTTSVQELVDGDGNTVRIVVSGKVVSIRREFDSNAQSHEYVDHLVEGLITTGFSIPGDDDAEEEEASDAEVRRFEYSKGTSNKFWEISVSGARHTVRYGRIGSKGQSKTKKFSSEAAARADADKLISSKLRKGYSEVDT